MSSKKMGLRRVGIVGLSTLVVTSMMTLTAATSFASANDYGVIGPVPEVARGAAAAPAASLTLEAENSWVSGVTQTFQIRPTGAPNDCSTAGGIAAAVGFAALPTVAVTDPGVTNNVADTPPAFTKALTSSTPACAVAGVLDVLTLALTNTSTGTVTDTYLFTLSGITYKVGTSALVGLVDVASAGTFVPAPSPGQQGNANVADASFTNTARVAAQPNATGVSLGTQTFQEFTAGSHFAGSTDMTLTLIGGGTFTDGITPTITVPAGYSVTAQPATTGGVNTYDFTIASPATPIKATVTVSGLKADVGANVNTRTLSATGTFSFPRQVSVINVLEFGVSPDSRTGGAQRWDTAALLFDQNFGGFVGTPPEQTPRSVNAVLSSGLNFPDALSANYLAGKLHTGILLTATGWLSQAAKVSILSNCISTVYITGETAAVSQATQDQVEALTVCNSPALFAPHVLVIRLGGPDRFATNQLVNEYNFAPSDTVLMTSGLNFPDALSVGPVAAGRQMPLIITRGTTLGTEENAQLSDFSPTNIVIAGGTAVVSQAIQNDLVSRGFKVFRLGGADRTLTAALVAQWATNGFNDGTGSIIDNGLGFGTGVTFVATGSVFADALAAGPVAASTGACTDGNALASGCGSVIVLTGNSTVLSAGIPSYLGNLTVGGDVSNLHALGLTAALSSSVMQAAAASIDLLN